jgi:zinc/manganese transport system substrate-binding protein
MRCTPVAAIALPLPLLAVALAACGDEGTAGAAGDRPQVVVTTNVLGDVVSDLVGDQAAVEVIMPPGSGPHEFQASPRQAAAMRDADALITNGAGFEEGLTDTIEAAEQDGVPTFGAIDAVDTLQLADDGGTDPHFFTDPARMATAAQGIADFLVDEVPGLDTPAFADQAEATIDGLHALDGEVERTLSAVPPDRRTLVTNHEVFGYFADRYGFEVVGAVIPAGTTQAEPSAAQLDELAHTIEERGVPAIFVETSSPARLADALADEVGDVDVVELFSESLGDEGSGGETYADMMRSNAERIADALASH